MHLETVIGSEVNFPVRHRILNIVLLFGVALSLITGLFNYFFGMDPLATSICLFSFLGLILIYYYSIVKRYYILPVILLVFLCIFVLTPVIWLSNGGTLGTVILYILIFSSLITALLEGSLRMIALFLLSFAGIGLMVLEYHNPEWIVGYVSNYDRFCDITFSMIILIIFNSAFIHIILHYYIREHQKSQQFSSQLEKNLIALRYQENMRQINQKLQQEIEERKQMEQELRSSEERFSKSFHSSPVPVCILSFDRLVLDVNDSFSQVFEFSRQDILGRNLDKLDLASNLTDSITLILAAKKSVRNLAITMKTNSGQERNVLLSVELIEINGEPCLLCAINDITGHIRLEKEVARLDRLNLVGEMAANIGHEIRNPLTTVRGFLQFYQERHKESINTVHFELMIDELDRANSIITEFLSLSKNKRIELSPADLNLIIVKLHPLMQADAVAAGKTVLTELAEIPHLLMDSNEIRQCILNLVRNALEAVPTKGTVTIRTFREGTETVLEIADDGPGIPPHILEQFGTPFITTKETGTGLGIAICYRIAERHNARIEIKTNSSGTAFRLRFCRYPADWISQLP